MSLIDLLLYSVPGLMAYFWLEKFGHIPSRQLSSIDQTGLTAVLWLPTTMLATAIMSLLHVTMPDLNSAEYGKTSLHLALFLVICAFSSFVIAFVWAWVIQRGYHWFINVVRKRVLHLSTLTREPTVWDAFFRSDGRASVLRIKHIGSGDCLVGEIANGPRILSGETNLILTQQDFWGQVVKKEDVRVDRILLRTDAGLVIEELSMEHLGEIIEKHDDLLALL